jgi:hypothetical protein
MRFTKFLLLAIGLLDVANADELQEHRYDLPTNKQYFPTCQSQALALYAGMIEKQHLLKIQNHFFVQYHIQMLNKTTRSIICDLDNGQIVRAQNLADFQQ